MTKRFNPKNLEEDILHYEGIDREDFDRDGTRYLCRVYSEPCDDCGKKIRWSHWVVCKAGEHGPGRPYTRRRFSRCAVCFAANLQVEKEFADNSELVSWHRNNGGGGGVNFMGKDGEVVPVKSLWKH